MTDDEFIDEIYKFTFREGDREQQNKAGDDHEKVLEWMKTDRELIECVTAVNIYFDFDMYNPKKLRDKLEHWAYLESILDPEAIKNIHTHNLSFERLAKRERRNGQAQV